MKKTYLVDRKRKVYNREMKKRLQKVNGSGKAQKTCIYEPQKRFAKVRIKESIKIILKPWNNWSNKIPTQLVLAVPTGYYSTGGTIRNNQVKLRNKHLKRKGGSLTVFKMTREEKKRRTNNGK